MNWIILTFLAFLVILYIFTSVKCEKQDDQTVTVCKGQVLDMFFLLDKSADNPWDDTLTNQFITNVVSGMDVSANKTRVGMVILTRIAKTQSMYFNRSTNRSTERVASIDEDLTDNQYIHDVLAYLRQNKDFRQDVSKIIIIITNRGLRHTNITVNQAKEAQKEAFYIFVLAIGQYRNDWLGVASDPDKDFLFVIKDILSLDTVRMTLLNRTCILTKSEDDKQQQTPFTCSGSGVFATLFYISGSVGTLNLTYQISDSFVASVTGDHSDIQWGFFFHNCIQYEIPFDKADKHCQSSASIVNASLLDLINQVDSAASVTVSDRGDHNQVAVIVVDDTSIVDARDQINLLVKDKSLEIILVDTSSAGVNDQVREAIGRPSNIVRFKSGTTPLEPVLKELNELTCEALKRSEDSIGLTAS